MNPLPGQSLEGVWEWIDEMVKTLGKTFTKGGFQGCTQKAEWKKVARWWWIWCNSLSTLCPSFNKLLKRRLNSGGAPSPASRSAFPQVSSIPEHRVTADL